MADFLAQEEIDSLLEIAENDSSKMEKLFGEIAIEKTAKKRNYAIYDFKRPNRISREQIRTLQNIHDKAARTLASQISALLRTMVTVDLASVDQMTYGEFIMSISNPTSFNILTIKPLEGRCVLEVNPNIAMTIIDRLLGGSGHVEAALKRDFTEIELSILQYILKIITKELKEAWSSVHVLNFSVESKESNYTNVQIAAQNEIVILATYQFKIKDEVGYISICYPVIYLEPILSKLLIKNFLQDSISKKTRSQEIKALLAGSRLEVEAILFEDSISFKEFMNLKEGVVIGSNISVKDSVMATVNRKKKYEVMFGVRDGKKSIKIKNMHYDEHIDTIQVLKEIEGKRNESLEQLYKDIDGAGDGGEDFFHEDK